MQIIANNQLSTQQLNALDELCRDCKAIDGNAIATYRHILSQNRPTPCNIFYYEQERLVGFLSTFFFYEDACEIVVMVAPSVRRQGIATQLLNEILPLINSHLVKTLIFLTPNGTSSQWLTQKGFLYTSSEYRMQRGLIAPIVIENKSLTIRLATEKDIPALYYIDSACFSASHLGTFSRFETLLCSPNYKLFIVYHEDVPIGKAHLCMEHDIVRLTDVGILPQFQGRGFGGVLLAHCINYCLMMKQCNICLDVETNNQQALRLYARLGFSVANSYDYWTVPIDVLMPH